jgi:streptogramin lyase
MTRAAIAAVVIVAAMSCTSDDPAPTSAPDPTEPELFEIDGRPSAVTIENDLVWVADDDEQVVHVLDERSGEPKGKPIEVERHPIAIDSDDGVVWVGHAGGEISRIDAKDRTVEGRRIGQSITDVVASKDGVFAIDHGGKTVSEIDPETTSVIRGVPVPKGAVRGVVGGEALWITGDETDVSRVELKQFVVRHVYKDVGDGPIGIHWDGEHVWSANSDDGTIADVEGNVFEEPIEVGRAPIALTDVDGELYVVVQDEQALVRVVDGKIVGPKIDLGIDPRGVEATDDSVWVVGTTDGGGGVVRVPV